MVNTQVQYIIAVCIGLMIANIFADLYNRRNKTIIAEQDGNMIETELKNNQYTFAEPSVIVPVKKGDKLEVFAEVDNYLIIKKGKKLFAYSV